MVKKHHKNILIFLLLVLSTGFITTNLIQNKFHFLRTRLQEEPMKFEAEIPRESFTTAWTPNGTTICDADNEQEDVKAIECEDHDAIIVWEDNRGETNFDIYAQRIDSNGEVRWISNGLGICNESNNQNFPDIISDGVGGAIIAWEDKREGSNNDIYMQRINSTGDVMWKLNGTVICNESNNQRNPRLISDGDEGAIVVWTDYRTGLGDIYAQQVNSTGHPKWRYNGTVICNASNTQDKPQLVSDGNGGAIIVWQDNRQGGGETDIYTQWINSTGHPKWNLNGTVICNASNTQLNPQLVSDGNGGAIIVWEDNRQGDSETDVYTQWINSTGHPKWDLNGTVICNASNKQQIPQLIGDEDDGAIITWRDNRFGIYDIYAQRIDSSGKPKWKLNGTVISNTTTSQFSPHLISDEAGGAIISWELHFEGSTHGIYAQRINSDGNVKWTPNGTDICTKYNAQNNQIISDGAGGAILVWQDMREGEPFDIYAQRIKNDVPTVNQPEDLTTSSGRSETIDWTLDDDCDGGFYRVLANNSLGNEYTWIEWTSWTNNNTSLKVPINRTVLGDFWYRIEYTDDQGYYGTPDTILVSIKANGIPTSNHPDDLSLSLNDSKTINWTLYDDYGGGMYRISVEDSNGNSSVWVDWSWWQDNVSFSVPINSSIQGAFNYTIEYYDDQGTSGTPDKVLVTIYGEMPTSDHPEDLTTTTDGSETIVWTLYDDFGGGQYRIIVNDSNGNSILWRNWTSWTNNTPISVTINRTLPGVYNYTIEYYDAQNQIGVPDTVIVSIEEALDDTDEGLILLIIVITSVSIGGGAAVGVGLLLFFLRKRGNI